MAGTLGENIAALVAQAQQILSDVHIIRQDIDEVRALVNFEGKWRDYRIIVQEIHRADGSMRYSYYSLDNNNQLICGFDNSPDRSEPFSYVMGPLGKPINMKKFHTNTMPATK